MSGINPFKVKAALGYSAGTTLYPLVKQMLQNQVNSEDCPTLSLELMNFNDDVDLVYPLGVFSVTGTYLGVAANEAQYMALWNANVDNQATGTIISGAGTTFQVSPAYINSVVNLYAQEFYSITAPANIQLMVGDNDTIVYGAGPTIKRGGIDGILTSSDAMREYNPDATIPGVQYKVPQFNLRVVTCTGYVNAAPMNIFHSRTSTVFGSRLSFGQYSIAGIIPKAIKHFYMCGQITTNYNLITNWNQCISLESFILRHSGGGPWGIGDDAFIPANIGSLSLLKVLVLSDFISVHAGGDSTPSTNTIAMLNQLTPNFLQLQLMANAAFTLLSFPLFLAAIPPTKQLIYLHSLAGNTTAQQIDDFINLLPAKLVGIVPTGEEAIRVPFTNALRTAASNAAKATLEAASWTFFL